MYNFLYKAVFRLHNCERGFESKTKHSLLIKRSSQYRFRGTVKGERMKDEDSMPGLERLADQLGKTKLRPVHEWHPASTGDMALRIARNGTWYYRDSPINRRRLVRLLASVMRKDDDGYCLVTPTEKLRIRVEDAPFLIVEMEQDGAGDTQRLLFRTNVDDVIAVDEHHPIVVTNDPLTGEPSPYVRVRDRLDALISRPVFYQLADLAVERDGTHSGELGVWSCSSFFVLGQSS